MAIPDYQSLMLPLLKIVGDQQEHSIRQAIDLLSEQFSLTQQERREILPSGQQAVFNNRVGWARTYLKKAGLLSSVRRGSFQITSRGLDVLRQNPRTIDIGFLLQFGEFRDFKNSKQDKTTLLTDAGEHDVRTPEEALASVYQELRTNLAGDLLRQIKASPPSLFEDIVVRLLLKMGYGGSLEDAGKAIGRAGDEGIDGIIKEDRLGLDIVYIQAKRWEGTVGRPEIQKFAGALQGQRARKGIFITTSDFSRDAEEYASRIDNKIVLIDGSQLAQFMIDYNIGVSTQVVYELKRIDLDYFTEQ